MVQNRIVNFLPLFRLTLTDDTEVDMSHCMNAILNATVSPENGLHSCLCMLTFFLYALYLFCLRTIIVWGGGAAVLVI